MDYGGDFEDPQLEGDEQHMDEYEDFRVTACIASHQITPSNQRFQSNASLLTATQPAHFAFNRRDIGVMVTGSSAFLQPPVRYGRSGMRADGYDPDDMPGDTRNEAARTRSRLRAQGRL